MTFKPNLYPTLEEHPTILCNKYYPGYHYPMTINHFGQYRTMLKWEQRHVDDVYVYRPHFTHHQALLELARHNYIETLKVYNHLQFIVRQDREIYILERLVAIQGGINKIAQDMIVEIQGSDPAACDSPEDQKEMATPDYQVSWIEDIPDYVQSVGRYAARWELARDAVKDLADKKAGEVLQIKLLDSRGANLCKSAVYSESAKIRENDPGFETRTVTHKNDDESVEIFVVRVK